MQLNSTLIIQHFPSLNDQKFIKEVISCAELCFVEAGEILIEAGSYGKFIPLVVKGYIKVSRIEKEGEVLLYYLSAGQTCTMTLQCCNSDNPSQVRAVAESDTVLLSLPAFKMKDWFSKFPTWQQFVLNTYQERFNSLLASIDHLVFDDLESRIITILKQRIKQEQTDSLEVTHQNLANDLNTSREVVSRILKKLEKEGEVKLGRNKVTLLGF